MAQTPQTYIQLEDGYLIIDSCKNSGVSRGIQYNIGGVEQLILPPDASFTGHGTGVIGVDNNGGMFFTTGGGGAITLGGDVTGPANANTVVKIQGTSVSSTHPTAGQVIEFNGSQWTPTTLGSFPPSGPAGGDLSGTYPNPTVAKVDGVSYPASPSTNTVPVVTGSNTVTYQQIADAQVSASAAIAVSKLAAGTNGYVLETVSGVPTWTVQSGLVTTLGGDVTGPSNANTVVKIYGNAVQNTGALGFGQNGSVLTWIAAASQWEPFPPGDFIVTVFASSGSWTCPVGVTSIIVNACAGGQGGNFGATLVGSNGHGGQAGTILLNSGVTVVPGTTYTVTIGGGGAGGTTLSVSGVSGGNTTFIGGAVSITVLGGGQIGSTGSAGGAINTNGTNAAGFYTTTYIGGIKGTDGGGGGQYPGGGGGGAGGNGNGANGGNGGSSATNGASAVANSGGGGGGGGGNESFSGSAGQGGAGASGYLFITYTVPPVATNYVSGSGFWHSTSGSLDTSASVGTAGQFALTNSGATDTVWTTLSGDVTDSTSTVGKITVVGIQGNTFTSGSPTKGQFVVATSTSNYGPVSLSGDVTDSSSTAGSITVVNINGASVPASGSLTTGNVLQVSGSAALSYAAVNLAGGSNYVTGALPVANLAHGTAAQVLMSNGTPATTWTSLSGDVTVGNTGVTTLKTVQAITTVTKTSSYAITTSDFNILANPSGAFNLTMPAPALGMVYHIWDISGTMETNNVTLVRHGSEKISGVAASRVLQTNWGHWVITTNGTDWFLG